MARIVHRGSAKAQEEAIPATLASMLAPIDRRAFGIAVGTVCGLAVYLLTVADLLRGPAAGRNLELLGEYFPGYAVSWVGALTGFAWTFLVGLCAGWFLALTRNLGIAAWIFMVRTRHEMALTRDFLDHM